MAIDYRQLYGDYDVNLGPTTGVSSSQPGNPYVNPSQAVAPSMMNLSIAQQNEMMQYDVEQQQKTQQALGYASQGRTILGKKGLAKIGTSLQKGYQNLAYKPGALYSGAGGAQFQSAINPATGAGMSVPAGGVMPAGFQAQGLTKFGQYGQAMTGQAGTAAAMKAGGGTALVGTAIKMIADDKDPTTMNVGETVGTAAQGAGTGAALMAALGATGPAGWIIGGGLALFGGLRKRNKARKAAKKAQSDWREKYDEQYDEFRDKQRAEGRGRAYSAMASQFQNPYGLGGMQDRYGMYSQAGFRYDNGGKTGEGNDFNSVLDYVSNQKNAESSTILNLMNTIAFHETGPHQRFDPAAIQGGDPDMPGRGLFQFEMGEKQGGNTAINHVKQMYDKMGMSMPAELQKAFDGTVGNASLDASKLSAEAQGILFLGDALMGRPRLQDYTGGKMNEFDWWAKYHKRSGVSEATRENFTGSQKAFSEWQNATPFNKGGKKEISAEFTGGESIVSKNNQNKIEKYLKGGDYAKAGKIVKNAPITPGEASHQSNPLPVAKGGMVYDQYGKYTGLKAEKGAGIYDHGNKFNVSDEAAGQLAAQDIEKWKRNGMYS